MRNFEERKEEIFRRSQQRIAQRKKQIKRTVFACVPVVLCVTVVSGYLVLGGFGAADNMAPEAAECPAYGMVMDSVIAEDSIEHVPEMGAPESMTSAVTGISLQMADSQQTFEDTQTMQQIRSWLGMYDMTTAETEDAQSSQKNDLPVSGGGELIITVTYADGSSAVYTVVDTVVTGPEGSWKISDEQKNQLVKLWEVEAKS